MIIEKKYLKKIVNESVEEALKSIVVPGMDEEIEEIEPISTETAIENLLKPTAIVKFLKDKLFLAQKELDNKIEEILYVYHINKHQLETEILNSKKLPKSSKDILENELGLKL